MKMKPASLNPVRYLEFVNSPEYREIERFFASDRDTESSQEQK